MKVGGRLEARHFEGDSLAVGMVTDIGYVEIVLQPRRLEEGYQALAPHAVDMTVAGLDVFVGALDDLITSKLLLARAQGRGPGRARRVDCLDEFLA